MSSPNIYNLSQNTGFTCMHVYLLYMNDLCIACACICLWCPSSSYVNYYMWPAPTLLLFLVAFLVSFMYMYTVILLVAFYFSIDVFMN